MMEKLCCASCVLGFLLVGSVHGGALLKSFDKTEEVICDECEKPIDNNGDSNKESATNGANVISQDVAKKEEQIINKKKIIGDPIVVRINGTKEFKRSEILADMKMVPEHLVKGVPPDRLFVMLRDQKISAYLMLEQAKRTGLDKTSDFLSKVEEIKNDLLSREYLMKELGQKTASEKVLQIKYKEYLATFKSLQEYKVLHIAVSSETVAKEILELLAKGDNFSTIAKEKSEAPSKASGGDEGYVPAEYLSEPLKQIISPLKKGEYTKEFFKNESGYHIFKCDERRNSEPQKFEEVKNALVQSVMREEMMKLLKRLEGLAKVERFNEDGSVAVSSIGELNAAPVKSQVN